MSGRKKTASYRMRFFRCVKGVLTLHPFRDRASIAQRMLACVPPSVGHSPPLRPKSVLIILIFI